MIIFIVQQFYLKVSGSIENYKRIGFQLFIAVL